MNSNSMSAGRATAYEPPKVSRHFRYDWQFAVDMSKLPLLRPASLIIGFMPLLTKASVTLFGLEILKVPPSMWIAWFSSVAFLLSWVILRLRCPAFILQFRHFGEYIAQQHSHRWIVWLFYNTITQLSSWQTIVQETLAKGISVDVGGSEIPEVYRVCPCRVKADSKSNSAPFSAPPDNANVHVFYPVNIGRDIYVPIHCYGQRLLLLLQEDDPQLLQKEKELFWILFSQAAKERPRWRCAFWALFYISVLLLAVNVIKNVVAVAGW